jgi:hypothetical protein
MLEAKAVRIALKQFELLWLEVHEFRPLELRVSTSKLKICTEIKTTLDSNITLQSIPISNHIKYEFLVFYTNLAFQSHM